MNEQNNNKNIAFTCSLSTEHYNIYNIDNDLHIIKNKATQVFKEIPPASTGNVEWLKMDYGTQTPDFWIWISNSTIVLEDTEYTTQERVFKFRTMGSL